MSYLVLARKWRPKRFSELVGQGHVVRALTNALDSDRVHHAFLFSGTRGVGKTTIARIFAKSLNCERGTSAEPCGECNACKDIDEGRFIDLLEIDAASNTGIDNVRELIDNAQYMPSRGRVKVYLIDEVHMLSKAAFNALLKTLEEPPGHVKFLLATTDPQKLPVTVLSRCLQFNLKRLDERQIGDQINMILEAEGIGVQGGAVAQLSRAADGSLRDGLSLLDQAIAYTGTGSGGQLEDAAVTAMLGTVDRTRVGALLDALADGDGAALLEQIAQLAEFSPDWGSVLDAFAEALHRLQVRQLVPAAKLETNGVDVDALAARLRPEVVQLWYQMALAGGRDLPLAPSARGGFEMSLLRMLAFRPAGAGLPGAGEVRSAPVAASQAGTDEPVSPGPGKTERAAPTLAARAADVVAPASIADAPSALCESTVIEPADNSARRTRHVVRESEPLPVASSAAPPPATGIADPDAWHDAIAASGLGGPALVLAEHAGFVGCADGVLRLSLAPGDAYLQSPALVAQVAEALAVPLGAPARIVFEATQVESAPAESLRHRKQRASDERQRSAEQAFMDDPHVQRLIAQEGARLVPDSIRPLDEH